MTEEEWLACNEPAPMLQFLRNRGKTSDRKLRLFSLACCRRVWPSLREWMHRRTVEVAEMYVEGSADLRAWQHLCKGAAQKLLENVSGPGAVVGYNVCRRSAYEAALETSTGAALTEPSAASRGKPDPAEHAVQCRLLREIVGNPFRPVAISPSWLKWNGGAIPKLARAVYEERSLPSGTLDNVRLAVLMDALEDAGCSDADILAHCRSGGEHVRGCWLIDLLLGKS
jgi:hypothetical protein